MDQLPSSEIALKLYINILRDIALEDPSLTELIDEMTLGSLMTDPKSFYASGSAAPQHVFSDDELLMFGSPVRRHLSISLRKRVSEEIRQLLCSIARCYPGGQSVGLDNLSLADALAGHERIKEDEASFIAELPNRTQRLMDEIQHKNQMVSESSRGIAELISQIAKVQADFDQKLTQALSVTLLVHDATRTASIELLATNIEVSLVKLSLTRVRAERAIYNYTNQSVSSPDQRNNTVGKALENAYIHTKKDETEMNTEIQALDRQLQEYESFMQLVGDGIGGYREVVDDWTKVKQETDECLQDLRRLGWTGIEEDR